MGRAVAVIAISALIGGCGGTELLTGTRPRPASSAQRQASLAAKPATASYLLALEAEQRKLAAAERRLPHRAPTPVALSRAISTLAAAIGRLAADLHTLAPPTPVRGLHDRLIAVMRTYAASLGAAARDARRQSGEPRAAGELLSATAATSREFSSTIAQIDRVLTP